MIQELTLGSMALLLWEVYDSPTYGVTSTASLRQVILRTCLWADGLFDWLKIRPQEGGKVTVIASKMSSAEIKQLFDKGTHSSLHNT